MTSWQARLALEPAIAAAAAVQRDGAFIKALRETTLVTDDKANSVAVVTQAGGFHDLVAETAANPLFGYLVQALFRITVPFASQLDFTNAPGNELPHCHEEIVDAIEAGDPEAAADAMRRDLLAAIEFARSDRGRHPRSAGALDANRRLEPIGTDGHRVFPPGRCLAMALAEAGCAGPFHGSGLGLCLRHKLTGREPR